MVSLGRFVRFFEFELFEWFEFGVSAPVEGAESVDSMLEALEGV